MFDFFVKMKLVSTVVHTLTATTLIWLLTMKPSRMVQEFDHCMYHKCSYSSSYISCSSYTFSHYISCIFSQAIYLHIPGKRNSKRINKKYNILVDILYLATGSSSILTQFASVLTFRFTSFARLANKRIITLLLAFFLGPVILTSYICNQRISQVFWNQSSA